MQLPLRSAPLHPDDSTKPLRSTAGPIRDFQINDVQAIASLVGNLGYPSTPEAIERRLEAMHEHLYKCFVANNNGEPKGFTGLNLPPFFSPGTKPWSR